MTEKPKRYYYYSLERGCLRDLGAIDAIGVGVDNGPASCSLTINLMRLAHGSSYRYTMLVAAHSDEWNVLSECRDVLDLLSKKAIRYPEEMTTMEPFYELRGHLEKLGYQNLGILER